MTWCPECGPNHPAHLYGVQCYVSGCTCIAPSPPLATRTTPNTLTESRTA